MLFVSFPAMLIFDKNKSKSSMNYEEFVKNHSGEIIEKLLTWVVAQDSFDIRFDFLDNDQWAMVTQHIYDEDKEISLRLHLDEQYDIYFGYYDEEDTFFEIVHSLNAEDLETIPGSLKKLMKKVLDDEQSMRISGKFITK